MLGGKAAQVRTDQLRTNLYTSLRCVVQFSVSCSVFVTRALYRVVQLGERINQSHRRPIRHARLLQATIQRPSGWGSLNICLLRVREESLWLAKLASASPFLRVPRLATIAQSLHKDKTVRLGRDALHYQSGGRELKYRQSGTIGHPYRVLRIDGEAPRFPQLRRRRENAWLRFRRICGNLPYAMT